MKRTPSQSAAAIRPRVLVVSHDPTFVETLADGLGQGGFDTLPTVSSRDAARMLQQERVDAVVTDLRMPSLDGIELLSISQRTSPLRPVILMTEFSGIDHAVEALRRGASHYVVKPFKLQELLVFLGRGLAQTQVQGGASSPRPEPAASPPTDEIVGSSAAMSELRELVGRVAEATATVLISGEIGTGKGIVARSIHARGARAHAPFVTVKCAEVSTRVLEQPASRPAGDAAAQISIAQRLLEDARGGTLFLDEVADLTLPLQAQLLQALESHRLDARVIASTSQNLRELAKAGSFRADLIFRIDVVNLEVPPLRSRSEDIPELADYFLERSRRRAPTSNVERFSPEAIALMREYAWPGNVRELEQCVEALVVLARGPEITSTQLPKTIVPTRPPPASFHGEVLPLREIGRRYVRWAYEQSGNKKMLTAERLQIDDKTLNKMLLGEADFRAGTTDAAK